MPNNAIKSLSTGKFLFSYSPNRVKISIITLNKEVLLTLHERILLEHKNLEKKIQSLKNQLLTLPDGKLIVTRNKNHYKWYVSDGKTSTYLPKKQRRLAEQLALKKYLTLELEAALTLENTTLYPDFTIKLPETDKIIYWEHFGLMDDPAYCKNVLSKLKLYMSNGIIPNINLITTYETGNEPLDTKQVNDMIQLFLK